MSACVTVLTERMARQELATVSAYAAERRDFTQASGGNTSAKSSAGIMYVKASGCTLGDVASGRGVAAVEWQPLWEREESPSRGLEVLREWNRSCLARAGGPRPSIEVSLHGLLGPVVLHTHPVVANALLCLDGGRAKIAEAACDLAEYLYLPYAMPGLEIGTLLWQALAERRHAATSEPRIVFLENHGLVVHGQNAADVIELHEKVVTTLATYLPRRAVELPFRLEDVSGCVDPETVRRIREAVPERSALTCIRTVPVRQKSSGEGSGVLFPDAAVFCGPAAVTVAESGSGAAAGITGLVAGYAAAWGQAPRIWNIREVAICSGDNPTEAAAVAEVWWAHESVGRLGSEIGRLRPLPWERVIQLLNSEAEAYRWGLAARPRGRS